MSRTAESPFEPPPGSREAHIFDIEQKRREPKNAFERFLLTPQGSRMMSALFQQIDDSRIIVQEVYEMGRKFKAGFTKTPYGLLTHRREAQVDLGRRDLTRLYIGNTAASAALGRQNVAKRNGDLEAEETFRDTEVIFRQGIRHEWLQGNYNPDSDTWYDRYEHLGYMRGSTLKLDLQPGHKRPDTTRTERRFSLQQANLNRP